MENKISYVENRYHAMDSLRSVTMLLGIAFHVCMSFSAFPFDIPWPRDTQQSKMLSGVVIAINLFHLQVFFLLAGFFARLLYRRIGTGAFLRHRSVRIFLPLVLGILTIAPVVGLLVAHGATQTSRAAHELIRARLSQCPIEMAHLWFLYFLMLYYVFTICLILPLLTRISLPHIFAYLDKAYRRLLSSFFKPFILAGILLLPMHFGTSWHAVGLATQPLAPIRILLYYGIFFGAGWWLHRHRDLLDMLRRFKWLYLATACVLFTAILALAPYEGNREFPYYACVRLAALTTANLYTSFMIFGMLGLFMAYQNVSRGTFRYLADASYWFYLAHLPIVLVLQIALATLDVSAIFKAAFILMVTLFLLFVSYQYGVRYTWLGTMLNGKRETLHKSLRGTHVLCKGSTNAMRLE